MQFLKENFPTFALLLCYLATLIAIVILMLAGQKVEGLAALGFAGALAGIIGSISGLNPSRGHSPQNITNSPGAQVLSDSQDGGAKDKA